MTGSVQQIKPTEVICDFTSREDLDEAVGVLKSQDFTRADMGIEKITDEYRYALNNTDRLTDRDLRTRFWLIRDSLQDIREENGLIGGLISLIGLGLFAATTIAFINLEAVRLTETPVISMMLLGIGLIVAGIAMSFWMIRDTKNQLLDERPDGFLRFWIKTPTESARNKAVHVLDHYGARHIRVQNKAIA